MMGPYAVKSWCAWRWGISILPIDRSACKLSMQRTDVSESSDTGKPPALSGGILAPEENPLHCTRSALLVGVASQCIEPTCSCHLVEGWSKASRACRTSTLYHPYTTSSPADAYGP